ncbi:MAG: hypothetical protein AB1758_31245 [Candidatus Eremiobacterota bacterium]
MTSATINPRIFMNEPTPPPPPPQGPEPVYEAVDQLLIALEDQLKQDPTLSEQLRQASKDVKTGFKESIVNTTAIPETAEACREAALNALAAGLIAGALDGAILFHTDAASKAAAPPAEGTEGIGEDIGKAIDKFLEELQQKFEQAKEELKRMGTEALQRGSAEGKALGATVVEEAGRFAGSGAHNLQYQGYLAAAFGLGYAVGGTDAAIVMLTDQVPGQQPTPPEPPAPPTPPEG